MGGLKRRDRGGRQAGSTAHLAALRAGLLASHTFVRVATRPMPVTLVWAA